MESDKTPFIFDVKVIQPDDLGTDPVGIKQELSNDSKDVNLRNGEFSHDFHEGSILLRPLKNGLLPHDVSSHTTNGTLKCLNKNTSWTANPVTFVSSKIDVKVRLHKDDLYEWCFKCHYCTYKSKKKHYLRRHILHTHMEVRPYACPCCNYRANMIGHLDDHIQSVHEKLKPYLCPECKMEFARQFNLIRHIREVHSKICNFSCPFCQYKCAQKLTLSRHIDGIHKGLKPHSCSHCGFKASQISSLKRHVKAIHEGIKPFICSYCEYRASRRTLLEAHIDTKHKRLFIPTFS